MCHIFHSTVPNTVSIFDGSEDHLLKFRDGNFLFDFSDLELRQSGWLWHVACPSFISMEKSRFGRKGVFQFGWWIRCGRGEQWWFADCNSNSKSLQKDQAEAKNYYTEEARTSKASCSEARCARDSRTAFWTTSEADAIFSVKSIWHPISKLAT